MLSGFRRFYPDVHPQLLLGSDVVDLVAKDIDLAMRLWVGPLPDSTLTARRMGGFPMGIYSAPGYLERAGVPQHPTDLADHDCLLVQHFFERQTVEWPLTRGDEHLSVPLRPGPWQATLRRSTASCLPETVC
jgi:DNA-binding transcriptional LysR family regulator